LFVLLIAYNFALKKNKLMLS